MVRAWSTRASTYVAIALAVGACGAHAAHASTLEQIDAPSALFDPGKQAMGATPPGSPPRALPLRLRAKVLLPEGYRRDDAKRYPVLYLLHGAAQAYDHWAAPRRGEIQALAAGFPGIVVMPEGGALSFYSDWWENGLRNGAKWESYYRDELIPLIERRYRIRPERRWHAIAGLSMGGTGAMYLAGQLPGYFGSASSFSGSLNEQDPLLTAFLATSATLFGPGIDQAHLWGPPGGWYAAAHNPTQLVANLAHTRLFVSYGTGTPCPGDRDGSDADGLGPNAPAALNPPLGNATFPVVLKTLELIGRSGSQAFATAADKAGIPVRVDAPSCGTHWWDTWYRAFRAARSFGFFKPVPATASSFTYTTSSQQGDAWGLKYAAAQKPTAALTLVRRRRSLTARGAGRLTVTTPAGCRIDATLPFTRTLPAGRCRPDAR